MAPVRGRLALVLALASTLLAPQVARADTATVTLDGIAIVADATYSCGSDMVEIEPTSVTPVNGNYPVLAIGYVYDYGSKQWLHTPSWTTVDGITQLTFPVAVPPYAYAWMQYAIANSSGGYDQTGTWVAISNDLDNDPTFCQ